MSNIGKYALLNNQLVPIGSANLSIASSAVLYGLSVYSVFYGQLTSDGVLLFRLNDHLERLRLSAKMIGLSGVSSEIESHLSPAKLSELIQANQPTTDQYFRVTIHATELVPGVRTRDLELTLSIFMYDAETILPPEGTRLKTSLWRRTADTAIPARAKVNGAYVNSALAKQDALDSGYHDCLFLNQNGYVSELSAANVFMVKRGQLFTPDCASDILEGITRRSLIDLAGQNNLTVTERKVALTELYTADEVFACGTSAFISPVTEIDNRIIGDGQTGPITTKLRSAFKIAQSDINHAWTTLLS